MSKNGRSPSVSRTVGAEQIADYLNLDNLDLDRTYTFKEFEIISDQLKTRSLKIKGEIINHFELDKFGKLVPIPPTTIDKETAVMEIGRQLSNWNIQTG